MVSYQYRFCPHSRCWGNRNVSGAPWPRPSGIIYPLLRNNFTTLGPTPPQSPSISGCIRRHPFGPLVECTLCVVPGIRVMNARTAPSFAPPSPVCRASIPDCDHSPHGGGASRFRTARKSHRSSIKPRLALVNCVHFWLESFRS